MAKLIPYALPSHVRKIQSLYKRTVRNLEAWYPHREVFRFQACIARSEFDVIANEKDMIKAKAMIEEKEEELWRNKHFQPKKCKEKQLVPTSPGGTSYEREVIPPDWVLDYWHPLEKAHYPEYFARRELRKKQFVEMWEKQYGPAPKEGHH